MLRDTIQRMTTREHAQIAKLEAQELLRELLSLQSGTQGEACAPSSEEDLYKLVAGQSSLEKAIIEAKRLVSAYDRVLADCDRVGLEPEIQLTHCWPANVRAAAV